MTFRVGQKVVCIKIGTWRDADTGVVPPYDHPHLGQVYTICFMDEYGGKTFLFLDEVQDQFACFLADHFRPIVERKTDISIFTAMLTPKKTRVRA